MRFSKLILKGSETIGNIRYPVGEGAPYTLLPLCFLAPIHSTHHTTTVLYVIPSPHTCISTLLLWQFCTAFTYGISSCQSDKRSIDLGKRSMPAWTRRSGPKHGLQTPGEEIAFTARPKINSHSQIFKYGRSIF